MALHNSVNVNGGDRKLVDSRSDVRQWSLGSPFLDADVPYILWYNYKETTIEKTYKWWGLTQSAAEGAVSTADQTEAAEGGAASYECSIENRVVGSYTLRKTLTAIVLTIETEQVVIEEETG